MNKPTPHEELYRFWRHATSGQPFAKEDGVPQPGYYRTRMRKGGPWVPVEIKCRQVIDATGELEEPEAMYAECIAGQINLDHHWQFLIPITVRDFDALVELHKSDPRMAATHAPLDLSEEPMRLK